MIDSSILAESLKPNDLKVIRGRRIAGRYMSSPARLNARVLAIESENLLLIVLPQRGQTMECPSGASFRGNNRSQSGQAVKYSKVLLSGCNTNSCLRIFSALVPYSGKAVTKNKKLS